MPARGYCGWVVLRTGVGDREMEVACCGSEAEARDMVRHLNAVAIPGRPLYWCEYFSTTSSLDHQQWGGEDAACV